MAYPDYSVVIISITENGETTDFAEAFFNDELAKKYYYKAISEGKRAFYYEKPKPTRFSRKDEISLVENTEIGAESIDIEVDDVKQKIGEITEPISKFFEFQVESARKVSEIVRTGNIAVGNKIWDLWAAGERLRSKVLNSNQYTAANTPAFELTFSNKRIVGKHNGFGQVTLDITKLWPNEDEVTEIEPTQVVTEIEGVTVNLGSYIMRKVHDGTETGFKTNTRIDTWVPAGFQVLETETRRYLSNGNGWYTSTIKEETQPPCPNIGTVISSAFNQDLMYPIVIDSGLVEYVQIGYQYLVIRVGEQCENVTGLEDTWMPEGTVVYETEDKIWKTDGEGGVNQEDKQPDTGGGGDNGGGDNGGGDNPPTCPDYGTIIRTETVDAEQGQSTWTLDARSGSYIAYTVLRDVIATGFCEEQTQEPYNEFTPEGTQIESFVNDDYTWEYTVFVAASGGYDYTGRDLSSGEDYEGPYVSQIDGVALPEQYTFPDGDCPKAGYHKGESGGWIIRLTKEDGTQSARQETREVVVTLPQGVYLNRTRPSPNTMPTNTMLFKTGNKWTGRFIPDGSCNWLPEDSDSLQARTIPENLNTNAGWFTNNRFTSPTKYQWNLSYYHGQGQRTLSDVWENARVAFYLDADGNITVNFTPPPPKDLKSL
jgi:hypothetical protein